MAHLPKKEKKPKIKKSHKIRKNVKKKYIPPKKIDTNKKEIIIKPDKKEQKSDENIKKITKIVNDDNNETKNFDLLFLIDATGSMGPYIAAAKDETENISKELRKSYPEYNFKYGYVFYRDPIDSRNDVHQVINLTDNVNSLPEKIQKIKAEGGGDLPEDWVGAYKKANNNISWRNGKRVIIHLADAGAHGKEFTPYDKYIKEGGKLIKELEKCVEKKIKIFGYVITEDARNSFNKCQQLYRTNGGEYEICDFIPEKKNFSDFGKISFYRCSSGEAERSLLKKRRMKESDFERCRRRMFDGERKWQKEINMKFKKRVLNSISTVVNKK